MTTIRCAPGLVSFPGKDMDGIGTSSRNPAVLISPHNLSPESAFVLAHIKAILFIPLSLNPMTVCISITIRN